MGRVAGGTIGWVWLGIFVSILLGYATVSVAELVSENKQSAPAICEPGAQNSTVSSRTDGYDAVFSLGFGLRQDQFDWSIAGNSSGTQPNIMSELEWSDVESFQLAFKNRTRLGRYFYFRSHMIYAWIQEGQLRDSDYSGHNRSNEFSRSISESSGDHIWELSIGAGYPFLLMGGRLMVAPLLGASVHTQKFRITDGYQVITWPQGPDTGPIDGLNSTYQAKWKSIWGGCDLRYRLISKSQKWMPMEFGMSFEVHRAQYSAVADWNLRNDLQHPVSFEQEADGLGYVLEGEWLIRLTPKWDMNLQFCYQKWSTDNGTDRVYLTDRTETTRLNEVNWESRSMMLGVTYRFW